MIHLALALSATLASTAALSEPAFTVTFRASAFSSTFWVIDQTSEWSEPYTRPHYRKALNQRFALTDADKELLKAYARMRSKYSDESQTEPGIANPVDGLLPPALSAPDAFAMAFFNAQDVAGAAASLKLSNAETETVRRVFDAFRPRIEQLLAKEPHLPQIVTQYEAWATQTQLAEFLSKMARFYGVTAKAGRALTVDLLWAPEGSSSATCVGPFMLIPLSDTQARDVKELKTMFGVTVHEFGHYFASLLDSGTRVAFGNTAASRGLPNQRHPNILDESTQVALGNIIFMRDRFPDAYDPTANFYNFEPNNDWPDAIDSLGRALTPVVEKHLGTEGAFSAAYLNDALGVQDRLFPPRAKHFARVALVHVENNQLASYFNGLFPGVSRFSFRNDPARFIAAVKENSALPRWYLATREHLADAESPVPQWAQALASRFKKGTLGCVQARRDEAGTMEFAAISTHVAAMRPVLIALQRASALPLKPLCVNETDTPGW